MSKRKISKRKKTKGSSCHDLIPEDGIILCCRCGKMVDLNLAESEAFQSKSEPSKFFCSNNCLRSYVLEEDEDEAK